MTPEVQLPGKIMERRYLFEQACFVRPFLFTSLSDSCWYMHLFPVIFLPQVPSRDIMVIGMNENFENFKKNVAALGLLGYPRPVASTDYCVDADVQLVCKYLRAYETGDINKLYKERK